MIYGIADVGSNTVRLSIYKCEGGEIRLLMNRKVMAGLADPGSIGVRAEDELTLTIMLGVALVMVPIVLVYQFWAYRLFSHKLTPNEVVNDSHSY